MLCVTDKLKEALQQIKNLCKLGHIDNKETRGVRPLVSQDFRKKENYI